jgi:hypothetical protein
MGTTKSELEGKDSVTLECDSCGESVDLIVKCPECKLWLCTDCYGDTGVEMCKDCMGDEEDEEDDSPEEPI